MNFVEEQLKISKNVIFDDEILRTTILMLKSTHKAAVSSKATATQRRE